MSAYGNSECHSFGRIKGKVFLIGGVSYSVASTRRRLSVPGVRMDKPSGLR